VSGASLSAGKVMWGPSLGVEASWLPSPEVPVAIEVGAGVAALMPIARDLEFDGYTPLEGGLGVTRLRLGIVWPSRTARPR
jgi:hypothetical protein